MARRLEAFETDAAEIEAGMFKHMFRNFLRCFTGYKLFWQLAAVALTYVIVASDFDWKYFEATRTSGSCAPALSPPSPASSSPI